MSKQNSPSNQQTLQKNDQQDNKKAIPSAPDQSSARHTPPAFNPNYVKHDASRRSPSSSRSSSSCSSSPSSRGIQATASPPIDIQTVDPLIASIFQQGFPSNYDHEDHINNSQHCTPASWLRLQDKENGLPGNIEYVIMDEPEEIEIPTTPKRTSRVSSFLHRPASSYTNSKNCHHQQESPSTSPRRVVELTEQGNHYGKAQVLAWRTQRASKAALRKALQLPKKHIRPAKALTKKSVEVVKEVSLRSVELARKHSPSITRRYSR